MSYECFLKMTRLYPIYPGGSVRELPPTPDCELIGRLATDVKKRELFKKLAVDLRAMAHDIQSMIGALQRYAMHRA